MQGAGNEKQHHTNKEDKALSVIDSAVEHQPNLAVDERKGKRAVRHFVRVFEGRKV